VAIADQVDGFLRRLSFRWLPGHCVLCAGASGRARDLCAACEQDLPFNTRCCARCALPLAAAEALCAHCLQSPPAFVSAVTAFRYEWPLAGLITRFKFGGDLACGRVLSGLLAERVMAALADRRIARPDLLLPVPLHHHRLRERGFNQALEIARLLGQRCALPICQEVLQRHQITAAQSGLDAKARRRNVRGAFTATGRIDGLQIALIDDVVTTAATVTECARVLKQAGAAAVQVWALARAPLPR